MSRARISAIDRLSRQSTYVSALESRPSWQTTGASLLSALGVPALATHSLRAYSDALAALLARGAPAPRPALLPAPLRARRSRTARRARPSRIEVSLAMA